MKNRLRYLLAGFLIYVSMSAAMTGASWASPFYQLRDVSGERDGHVVAGSQWFATVWERLSNNSARQGTRGGEAPAFPMVTSADLISGFNGVYLDDPQYGSTGGDASFDAIQSVFLVQKEGRGSLGVRFGNSYGRSQGAAKDAMQDLLVSVPNYGVRINPNKPQTVAPNDWLPVSVDLQSESPQSYGSALGYLTFRQSAANDIGFTGYRESIKIPFVVASVYDGTAADAGNELYFEMTILNSGDIVTRNRFRWGGDRDLTRDLGTFFMIRGNSTPSYTLDTKITNRTGTRYRAQRYDTNGSSYQDIVPEHWAYDLASDLYGTLPADFQLDPQSQIAPGLITAYRSKMDMTYGSSESFRLYPYQGAEPPKDLRLTFRKVGGLTSYGSMSASGTTSPWTVGGFNMTFADVVQNSSNTAAEIAAFAGGNPVMPPVGYVLTGVSDRYIKADAFNSFMISTDVPAGLLGSNDIALLPVHIRLRVSRLESPIVGIWKDLADADSVLNTLANTCAVWVRSDNTAERDMNLFTTLRNRGVSIEKCLQAFTYEDFLYIDFVVLLADAVSQNSGKTAFCQVVEDDKIPYILIGDGAVDNAWNLTFYVAPTGSNPTPEPKPDPTPSEGGGGGCNSGFSAAIMVLGIFLTRQSFRR